MFASMVMAAALFFTVGGIFMKLSEGLTKFWPTVIVFALFVIGTALQTLAMKREDLAVTYLLSLGGGARIDPRLRLRRLVVQRKLHSGAHRRRRAHRRRHHLVALSLLTRLGSAAARSGGRRPRLRGPRSLKPPATCAALRGSRCRPAATGRAARRQG